MLSAICCLMLLLTFFRTLQRMLARKSLLKTLKEYQTNIQCILLRDKGPIRTPDVPSPRHQESRSCPAAGQTTLLLPTRIVLQPLSCNALSLHDELALATQKVSTPPVPPHPFMEPRLGDRLYQLKGELAWAMASHPRGGFAEDLICISFRGHRRQGSG